MHVVNTVLIDHELLCAAGVGGCKARSCSHCNVCGVLESMAILTGLSCTGVWGANNVFLSALSDGSTTATAGMVNKGVMGGLLGTWPLHCSL
jgi:hypothetical protein